MARPRSEDKRRAILVAATEVIAEEGLGAPTARIAKQAGVAEGTVFTYFPTKDDLLNALYLELKDQMREALLSTYPSRATVQKRLRHVWQQYVRWGATNAAARRTLRQLDVSGRIAPKTKAAGALPFAEFDAMMRESLAQGHLHGISPAFVASVLTSLAEATMDHMVREPAHAERYAAAGFEMLWGAIGPKPVQ